MKRKRPVVGLLLDTFFENYEIDIWSGVVHAAELEDVNLVCFVGGVLNSPYYHYAQRNAVYSLIDEKNIDGIIAVSTSIGSWIGSDGLRRFYEGFSRLPVVSIGLDIEGTDSVVVDNSTGMSDLMDHLILHHGYREIAFIRGPEDNPDADRRFEIYKSKLNEFSIPYNDDFVVQGDFFKASASRALSILLDERFVSPDVIIASNDVVAIAVIDDLKRRGFRIPEDITVVGFDNIDESRYLSQPLTTVSQPTYELGCKAMEMLLSRIRKGSSSGKTVLPSKIMVRRSCGCFQNRELDIPEPESGPEVLSIDDVSFKRSITGDVLKVMEDNFVRYKNLEVINGWAAQLVESLFLDIKNKNRSTFLEILENIVTEAIIVDIEVLTWHKILIRLFTRLKNKASGSEEKKFLDTLYKRALEMIWEITVRSLTYLKLKAEEKDELLFSISQAFITIFDYERLRGIISRELPPLGIKECFISLYAEDSRQGNARLIVSHRFGEEPVNPEPTLFNSRELIPGGLDRMNKRVSLIAMSLFYKEEQLGFALFDIGTDTGYVYETLVVQISNALKGIKLLGEVQKHADSLEAKVRARTTELREANFMLRQEIEERRKTAEILKKKNEEIEELNRKLEQKSKIDSLTQLYNREAFFDLLENEVKRTSRNIWRLEDIPQLHKPSGAFNNHIGALTIMLIDIDHFKTINDTHGHLVGDKVLQKLGRLFQRKDILRKEDFVGRFGGEEFIIVCPSTQAQNAKSLAGRLAAEFKAISFEGINNETFHVTLSIGISEYSSVDRDAISLIHRADKAMYWAKEHGRDRIAVYEEVFNSQQF